MPLFVLTALTLPSFLLHGCGKPIPRLAEVRPLVNSGGGHVGGLRDALPRGGPVRVLLVHGMMTHERGYSASWQSEIGRALELSRLQAPTEIPVDRGYEVSFHAGPVSYDLVAPPSELRRSVWGSPDEPNVPQVVFYELFWAPLRNQLKGFFMSCFETGKAPPLVADCPSYDGALRNWYSRASLNRGAKSALMVDGFADATLVLGDAADVLRDDVTLAMCLIGLDSPIGTAEGHSGRCGIPDEQRAALETRILTDPLFVLTHSLGSFLVMDAQRHYYRADTTLRTSASPAVEQLRNATVFMMANQVSLLHLSRLSAVCAPRAKGADCPNPVLATDRRSTRPPATATRYVAFNDADDLLGFDLPWYLGRDSGFGKLINVSVDNDVGDLFRAFKNPLATHTEYHLNPNVVKLIVDGIDVPGGD